MGTKARLRVANARSLIGQSARWMAVCLGLLVASAAAVEAQTGRVTGRVSDASSGAPLSEVQVYLVGGQIGALSRQDGRFLLLNVPVGTHQIRAERIGLGASTQEVVVTAGGTVEINFSLESQAFGLDEIVVTGTAGASRRREVGNSIAQLDIAEMPDKPAQVTDMLQSAAPGIEVTGVGGGIGNGKRIVLRGNSSVSMSNQPIIYVDGVRMMSGCVPADGCPRVSGRSRRERHGQPLGQHQPERHRAHRGHQGLGGDDPLRDRGVRGRDPDLHQARLHRRPGVERGDPAGRVVDSQVGRRAGADYQTGWIPTSRRVTRGTTCCPSAVAAQSLQYFISGQLDDQTGILPNDQLEKYVVRGNFAVSPADNLQVQWNTTYANQWQQNAPEGNNAQGITLNAFRGERNYFGTEDPDVLRVVFDYDIQQRIERLHDRGYAHVLAVGRTSRIGSRSGTTTRSRKLVTCARSGSRSSRRARCRTTCGRTRILTFDYVGHVRFRPERDPSVPASPGADRRWATRSGRSRSGVRTSRAPRPRRCSSASIKIGEEAREKVWNAGFFLQNVLDISEPLLLHRRPAGRRQQRVR